MAIWGAATGFRHASAADNGATCVLAGGWLAAGTGRADGLAGHRAGPDTANTALARIGRGGEGAQRRDKTAKASNSRGHAWPVRAARAGNREPEAFMSPCRRWSGSPAAAFCLETACCEHMAAADDERRGACSAARRGKAEARCR